MTGSSNGMPVVGRADLGATELGPAELGPAEVGISVVLPCLNEAASVAGCVERALRAIRETGLTGEVIVCDNGSTDGSPELAAAAGARVIHEPRRGYGSAYLRGFSEARGDFLVMGDADSSYDFDEIPNLITQLGYGYDYDYVVGSRFTGRILPGAMPWAHRYIGNPVLTGVLNRLFETRLSDAHSGLRAMTRGAYQRLALRCTGMELASEIAVRAAQTGLRTVEVPITYHPRAGTSKLRPLQDGWRHLRFLVGMVPGLMMILSGLLLLAVAAGAAVAAQPELLGASPGSALRLTTLFALVGLVSSQVVVLGAASHLHSLSLMRDTRSRMSRTLERALRSTALRRLGPGLFVIGSAAALATLLAASSRPSDFTNHLTLSVISLTVMMLGVQIWIAIGYLARVQAGASGGLALAVQHPRPGNDENPQRPERFSL
jgi:hypothetical protein